MTTVPREWRWVVLEGTRCGRCSRLIPVGEPMCLVSTAHLRRCTVCVGPAPAEFINEPGAAAPAPYDPSVQQPTVSRKGTPALPFDGKAAAAGRDD